MIKGIGTDIIEISRIEDAIMRTPRFFERIYTQKERDHYIVSQKKVESLAGLFAAKEAVSKALGTGFRNFTTSDIEVLPNALGKPEVTLYNGALEEANNQGITTIHLSISHCKQYATAYVIAEGAIKE